MVMKACSTPMFFGFEKNIHKVAINISTSYYGNISKIKLVKGGIHSWQILKQESLIPGSSQVGADLAVGLFSCS